MDDQFAICVWDTKSDIVNEFCEVLKLSFNKEVDISHVRDQFIWQHTQNPFGSSIVLYAVDVEKNVIASIQTFMVRKIVYNDFRIICYESGNSATSPDYRKQGLWSRLFNHGIQVMNDNNASFWYGFPNKISYPILLRIGATDYGKLNYLIKPTGNYFKLPYYYILKKNEMKNFVQDPKEMNKRFTSLEIDDNVLKTERDNNFKNLWYGERNSDYYNWRLFHSPMYTYENVEDDRCTAFIKRGYRSGLHEVKLVDVLFRVEDSLIRKAVKDLCRTIREFYKPDFISISLTIDHPYYEKFASEGFYRAPVTVKLVNYPLRGCPPGLEKKPFALSNLDFDVE